VFFTVAQGFFTPLFDAYNMSLVYTEITLKNADDILLGAIPMEAMDLTVNPRKEEVVGAHGDDEIHKIKSAIGCLGQFADPLTIDPFGIKISPYSIAINIQPASFFSNFT
jgi:hypothetical protein